MTHVSVERHALIALLRGDEPFKPSDLKRMHMERGSFQDILVENMAGDARVEDALARTASEIEAWEADGTRLLTFLDPQYPAQLQDVHDFPLFIFTRGRLPQATQRDHGVSIVGSRDASPWAIESAQVIASSLANRGYSIVSGLAAGIDTAAHEAALALHARTVGVLGTGTRQTYPPRNASLQARVSSTGLLISQFWPDDGPRKWSFPMRNSVMSAYSNVTVVVEASEKSGTRHQVREAIKHGRPVVLSGAVAGSTSWGKMYAQDTDNQVHVAHTESDAIRLVGELSEPVLPPLAMGA